MNMRIAMLQLRVYMNKQENLDNAERMLRQAAKNDVDMAVLPEMFCCPYGNKYFKIYGEEEGGPAYERLSNLAKELGIYIVGGSIPELEGDKIYNTSYVFDRNGENIAKHRKVHMFDINIPGKKVFLESDTLTPGDKTTVFDTEFGKMGLCVCFDFRFQAMSKEMGDAGARIIIVPAAFNMITGPAHWELMIRQRAVDNQLFTVAVAPARDESFTGYISYANSMAADPWGRVLTRLGEKEDIGYADIDFDLIETTRNSLPIVRPLSISRK